MHIEKNVGEVLFKWLDALKQKVYDNAKEVIGSEKCIFIIIFTITFSYLFI